MRVGFVTFCAFLFGLMGLSGIHAQQYLNLTAADLTPCGLGCVITAIQASGCRLDDPLCQCASKQLAQSASSCLNSNCTMHDGLVAVKVNASLCRKPLGQSRSDIFLVILVLVYSIAVMFVALRFITKAMKGTKCRVDWSDWLLFFAVFCAIPNFYFCIKGSRNGFGKHFWELQDGQLKEILKMIYVAENIYIFQLAIPKLSILIFYLHSIPNEGFRRAVYITMCLIVISNTILSTLSVVGCYPIPSFWDRDIKGHCLDINAVAYSVGGLSIVQDLVIIALPMPVLKDMRLPRREKAMVLFMFAVGSSSVVISILRAQSIVGFGNSLDPSWDYIIITTWSIFEVYTAIITASLPTIRHLLVYLFPRSCAMARPNRENPKRPNRSLLVSPQRSSNRKPLRYPLYSSRRIQEREITVRLGVGKDLKMGPRLDLYDKIA